MYNVADYGLMISENPRMERFVEALRRAVKPGSVVLDLGAGPCVFALLACQFGARRVYAIEADSVIQLGRELAAANGLEGKIDFYHAFSTDITLPERADVIVSDLRGILPFFDHHLPSILDARQRLLAPGGTLIPARDTLWAALADAPDLYQKLTRGWDSTCYGIKLTPAWKPLINNWEKARPRGDQLLTSPRCWFELDYATFTGSSAAATIAWQVERPGTAHGLAVWFDCILKDDVGFSNSPTLPETIYGGAFFPLYQPVTLAAGDQVTVELHADLVGDDYVWRWNTRVEGKADFKQSTFHATVLSADEVHKRSAEYVPVLTEGGRIEKQVLEDMDKGLPLAQIADNLARAFPDRFTDRKQALTHAGNLAVKHCK